MSCWDGALRARAARVRAGRMGLPPARAEDGCARARAATGDGDRRRALPRAAARTWRAARARRRHRHGRDRARDRRRASRRARHRGRLVAATRVALARENAERLRLDVDVRAGRPRRRRGGLGPRRLQPALRHAGRVGRRCSRRSATGSRAARSSASVCTSRSRASPTTRRLVLEVGECQAQTWPGRSRRSGTRTCDVTPDLAGHARVVEGRRGERRRSRRCAPGSRSCSRSTPSTASRPSRTTSVDAPPLRAQGPRRRRSRRRSSPPTSSACSSAVPRAAGRAATPRAAAARAAHARRPEPGAAASAG